MEPADCSTAMMQHHVSAYHRHTQAAPTRHTPGTGFVTADPVLPWDNCRSYCHCEHCQHPLLMGCLPYFTPLPLAQQVRGSRHRGHGVSMH